MKWIKFSRVADLIVSTVYKRSKWKKTILPISTQAILSKHNKILLKKNKFYCTLK